MLSGVLSLYEPWRRWHSVVNNLAQKIVDEAPRSYGVIHTFDDELPEEPGFHVIKIAGPRLVYEKDRDLAAVNYID
jgi:hypothetical protein